jgi:hypothetical protein
MTRLAILFALVLPMSASAGTFTFFQTPSKKIGCVYSTSPAYVRCDISSGLKPPPAKPRGCQNDWTFGYEMSPRGRARTVCAGDTVFSPSARVIKYGTTWHGGAFSCSSQRSGLRCRNSSGHGFFLSKQRSYRF